MWRHNFEGNNPYTLACSQLVNIFTRKDESSANSLKILHSKGAATSRQKLKWGRGGCVPWARIYKFVLLPVAVQSARERTRDQRIAQSLNRHVHPGAPQQNVKKRDMRIRRYLETDEWQVAPDLRVLVVQNVRFRQRVLGFREVSKLSIIDQASNQQRGKKWQGAKHYREKALKMWCRQYDTDRGDTLFYSGAILRQRLLHKMTNPRQVSWLVLTVETWPRNSILGIDIYW